MFLSNTRFKFFGIAILRNTICKFFSVAIYLAADLGYDNCVNPIFVNYRRFHSRMNGYTPMKRLTVLVQ